MGSRESTVSTALDKTKTTIFQFLQILLEDSICLKKINKNED